jgi:hypothetical protein
MLFRNVTTKQHGVTLYNQAVLYFTSYET